MTYHPQDIYLERKQLGYRILSDILLQRTSSRLKVQGRFNPHSPGKDIEWHYKTSLWGMSSKYSGGTNK